MRISLAVLLVLASWSALGQVKTPFQEATGHNTAACSNDNTQAYCPLGGFPVGEGPWTGGWADNRLSILTRVIHPGVADYGNPQYLPGNIAKGRGAPPWPDAAHPGDVHNLLYAGNTTKVFAVVQHWFSTSPLAPPQVVEDPPPPGSPTPYRQTVDVGKGYAGQKVTGYSVNDCAYIDAMVDDLWERGFDGIIGFAAEGSYTCATVPLSSGHYQGQQSNFTASCGETSAQWWVDHGLQKLQNSMLRHPEMQYAMMFAGAFTNRVTCGCKNKDCDYVSPGPGADPPSDYYQAQCIRDQIYAQLTYYAKGNAKVPKPCASGPEQPAPGYFQRPNYLTPAPNRPVVQLFFDAPKLLQQCNRHSCIVDIQANVHCGSQAECWQQIWSDVAQFASSKLGLQPYFIDKSGPQTADGAYMWTRPQRYYPPGTHGMTTKESIRRQEDWGEAAAGAAYAAWAQSPKGAGLYFGAAWKGVDDRFWNNASTIDQGLVTSQRCGQTWLETFAEPGKSFNSKRQLPYMIVPTYDDHEAGTAFQNGIDNCARISASLEGTALSWQAAFTDQKYGSVTTFDHYRLLDSPDGKQVTVVKDRIPPSLHGSLDLSTLHLPSGPHVLYVELMAKPGLLNELSGPVPVTLPLE